jgi:bacterioferritin-associated ferredoxin
MYVCICNAVTDRTIRQAAADGVTTLSELTMRTGCAATCGSCANLAEEILTTERRVAARTRAFSLPLVAA